MKRYWDKGKLTWVAPGAVWWNREEVDLLLPWLYMMRAGRYLPEPVDGGYSKGKRSGRSSHAPYETVCQVAAEMDRRLDHCRTRRLGSLPRLFVEHSYCDQMTDHGIAKRYGMEDWEVRRHINSVVSYISSGKCGRWLECSGPTWCCSLFTSCKRHRPALSYAEWVRERRHSWSPVRKVPRLPNMMTSSMARDAK